MGYVVGGRFEGLRIYNGIIIDDNDEPIAARVLGMKRDSTAKGGFVTTYNDFALGFANAAHLASEYEWHEMGRPLPRIAASVLHWMNKEQIDENILKEIEKCDIRCANCHRRRTAKQLGYAKYLLQQNELKNEVVTQ